VRSRDTFLRPTHLIGFASAEAITPERTEQKAEIKHLRVSSLLCVPDLARNQVIFRRSRPISHNSYDTRSSRLNRARSMLAWPPATPSAARAIPRLRRPPAGGGRIAAQGFNIEIFENSDNSEIGGGGGIDRNVERRVVTET
jgi:hypothetical protein